MRTFVTSRLVPLMQKEEFQHNPYATNAYVTVGPLAKQVLHGKNAQCYLVHILPLFYLPVNVNCNSSPNHERNLIPIEVVALAGKKTVKLEARSGPKTNLKTNKRSRSSGLEFKLDELRKELASLDGGIFPHSVLSTQQITVLSDEKPKSMEEVQFAKPTTVFLVSTLLSPGMMGAGKGLRQL